MKYKIFYNRDCMKYGVQKRITDYMGTRYTQILIKGNKEVVPGATGNKRVKCYTPYKAVAQRWIEQVQATK